MELCFNSMCQQPVTVRSSRGWRRRTGDFADLCPRCASAYEDGIFCETFHLNASGWRCCETCGKQIHCGCIVSFHMFVLLDAGGIECMGCARRSFVLTPNPAWPPPTLYNHGIPDRSKDHSLINWSTIAGSGPVPWRESPSWFNNNTSQVELNAKMPSQVEVPGGIDRLNAHERVPICFLDKNKNWESSGRIINGSLKSCAFENIENEVSGNKYEEQPTTCINVTHQSDFSILEPSTQTTHFCPALNPEFRREIAEKDKVSGIRACVIPPPAIGNCFPSSSGVGSNDKAQTHNGNAREDGRVQNQLPLRNWPRINNQELQAISRHPRATITPLFEKTLTASDAGRMGRLVLPKKCAEAYFPEISNPEGMPLMIQDMKGKKWVFQFRFWPNNSSRMYVLEGVTPCIQSMQLIAGDAVTFSRLEPEGTLVMGGRKYPTLPGNQSKKSNHSGNEVSTHREVTARASKSGEAFSAPIHVEENMISSSLLATRQDNLADPASRRTEANDVKYVANDVLGGEIFLSKRKNSTLGSKSKRLRIGNDQIIELEITLKEVQGLLRPPSDYAPQIVVIDGNEIAEFEEPPIIGRPTILATDCMGGKFQWAQCEDCFKWRRVPGDFLLPSRWTCYKNSWDPERSLCSAAQELIPKELEDLLITAKKLKSKKEDEPDSVDALKGLDELANLAIHEKGNILPSSQTTIKHPGHRPGCTCVTCIQSPCGKGPKHKQTCTCNACLTMKCRFQTIMSKRETKQTETKRQKLQQPEDILLCSDTANCSSSHEAVTNDGSGHDPYKKKFFESPFKGQIDLNVQPEREEDFSPPSDSGGMMRLLQNASESFLNKQKDLSSSANGFSPSDSGGMMRLLQSASESSPNKQKSYRLLQSASESFLNGQKDLRLLQSASESFLNEHRDLSSSANGNSASVSGGMMRLLQSASESFLNKQKDPSSSANGNSLVNPALE